MRKSPSAAAALLLTACSAQPAVNHSANAPADSTASEQPAAPDTSRNPDVSLAVAAIDRDGDGRMTQAEWTAAGAPQSSFNGLDKGARGYVTKADMNNGPAPRGIDLNGDGKLTLDEFKEFDRRMAIANGKGVPASQP